MGNEKFEEGYKAFVENTKKFYAGEIPVGQYKGMSGGFGSYAQRGANSGMLRLRFTGGRILVDQLGFIIDAIEKYHIDLVHFTTCQSVQLHNLSAEAICDLSDRCRAYKISTRGAGGDFPRNIMAPPLSGVEIGEYIDVTPYARAMEAYLYDRIEEVHLPRKLKIAFTNSSKNITHATFRDMGFVAKRNKTFDVYIAGGLGPNPKLGVCVDRGINTRYVLYYVEAMISLFTKYGNYENRGKSRTRYLQDTLGKSLKTKFHEELELAFKNSILDIEEKEDSSKYIYRKLPKVLDGITRIKKQKQKDLYSVHYHPIGGNPDIDVLKRLYEIAKCNKKIELRLSPDESVYIIHATKEEVLQIVDITKNSAVNRLEESVACIGADICQVGLRSSQKLLEEIIASSREWKEVADVLPQIHISGCPSSCGTQQIGAMGFRGASKKVDGVMEAAFEFAIGGIEAKGKEKFGQTVGVITQKDIPLFLKEVGEALLQAKESFETWYQMHPEILLDIAGKYM